MKQFTFLSILFVLILNSCAPSLHQLENFETVKGLEHGYLLVTLENHSEEILLFQKYNQHKNAEQLAKKDARYNCNIKQAIAKNYDYSKVIFTYSNKHSDSIRYQTLEGEPVELIDKNKLYLLTIATTTNNQNDREEELMELKITPKKTPLLESSTLYVSSKLNQSLNGYSNLVKKMNAHLYRLNKAAEKNLFHAIN